MNKYTFCKISTSHYTHLSNSSSGPTKAATKYYNSIRTTALSLELPIHAQTPNQFPAHYVPCCTEHY